MNDAALVNTMIGLGKKLGLSVIDERIEDTHIVDLLLELNCSEGQGYYCGHPMTVPFLITRLISSGEGR